MLNYNEASTATDERQWNLNHPCHVFKLLQVFFLEDKDQMKRLLLNLYFLYRMDIFFKLYDCTTIKGLLNVEEVCLGHRDWPFHVWLLRCSTVSFTLSSSHWSGFMG